MQEALPNASHFHFAGHGKYEGRFGFGSTLALAKKSRLSIYDILSIDVPQTVVLAACETAGTNASSGRAPRGPGRVSLAHAFVLRGASAVLASNRMVDDTVALELTRSLYRKAARHKPPAASASPPLASSAPRPRAGDEGESWLVESSLATLRDQLREKPKTDWSAFRVLVP